MVRAKTSLNDFQRRMFESWLLIEFTYEKKYSRMDHVKFLEETSETWSDMVCLEQTTKLVYFGIYNFKIKH